MKEKKDILFLCQFFYPEYVSSATLPFDTAKALKQAGFSVNVICGFPKEYNKKNNIPVKEYVEGIYIKRVRYLNLERSRFFGRIVNYFSFTIAVMFRFFEFRKFKLLIVYSNPPVLPYVASLARKIFGVELIFVCYDVYPEIAI
ncbi:MAG: glycosyltransferase family 4 protein, partial [Clostridiales bacterium]|nr:glycosyltransferase family 4 protein [Clostridiales bacterium]